jgi:hypothetical protein
VNCLKANSRNFHCVLQAAVLGIRQLRKAESYGDRMICHFRGQFAPLIVDFHEPSTLVGSNSFHPATGKLAFGVHIE